MSKRPFMIGVLTGLVLALALGFGALTLAGGTSAAGSSFRFGDAVRGALVRRDARPATGASSQQADDAADETDAANDTDAEQDGSDRTMRAKIIGKALPRPGAFGHGAGDVTMLQGFSPCGGGMMGMPGVMELHHLEMLDGQAVVAGVEEGSAAEAAGLAEGDVITAIDGVEVESTDALSAAIGDRAPGNSISLTIESAEGETREVEATLGAHPDDPERGFLGVMLGQTITFESESMPEGMLGLPGGGQWFGEEGKLPFDLPMHDGQLHFELGDGPGMFDLDGLEALAVDGVLEGALVQDFTGDGPAADAGLVAGDVITAIDGEPVDGADALVAALAGRAPGESLALTVLRKGESEPLTIDATLGARPDDEAAGWLGVEVGTLRIQIDGQGNSEHHFDMGNLHEHLRDLLRGEGQDGEVDGDGPRHFRFRIGPGGDANGAPSEALELDRGGEA